MTWPLDMPFGGPLPEDYQRLLSRLMPDGLSQDRDGPRMRELEAYATVLWVGRAAINRAVAQSQPSIAIEMLEAWEREYGLPNDAARSLEERQARLLAAERSLAGASPERLAQAIETVAPTAAMLANSRQQIIDQAALATMVYHVACQLDLADWLTPAIRRSITAILERTIPARLHRVPAFLRTNETPSVTGRDDAWLFVEDDPRWASTTHFFGRSAMRRNPTALAVNVPFARHREYAGLVRLEADDLNAIQDHTLLGACDGAGVADAYAGTGVGPAPICFAQSAPLGPGGTVVLDNAMDWRDRYIMTVLRYSTVNIRPGQAGDATVGTQIAGMWSSQDGATTAPVGDFWTFATDLHIYANSVGGALTITNNSASTLYFVGMCIATPDLGKR